jgi:hypothetical protein
MKLKIKNLDKIIGVYIDYDIYRVRETDNFYVFHVRKGSKNERSIHLFRKGMIDPDTFDTVYRFDIGRESYVTAKWFGDFKNAVNIIVNLYDVLAPTYPIKPQTT